MLFFSVFAIKICLLSLFMLTHFTWRVIWSIFITLPEIVFFPFYYSFKSGEQYLFKVGLFSEILRSIRDQKSIFLFFLLQVSCFYRISITITDTNRCVSNFDHLETNSWSDCFLTPMEQFCSYIMARTTNILWNDDDVRFVLDQHV